MQKSIFVGNGINLLTKSAKSWQDVLRELSAIVGDPSLIDFIDYMPFTLFYEAVCSGYFRRGEKSDIALKRHIAKLLSSMKHNPFHYQIAKLGLGHIITTNYDYCLENSILADKPLAHDNLRSENRYSVFRRTKINSSYIWHIHGEINKPLSIMLGNAQYGGHFQKIRTYLTTPNTSPFIAGIRDFEKEKIYSWVDVFLRDEVHIIGFSLDYSEIDLWGLLSYKSRIQRVSKIQGGQTYYYHWTSKLENNSDKAKIRLLESLGVKVVKVFDIKDYAKEYENFIANFKSL